MNKDKITVKESCKILGISRQTLYVHFKKLGITTQKIGNKAFINKQNLERVRKSVKEVSIDSQPDSTSDKSNKNSFNQKEKESVRSDNPTLTVLTDQLKIKDQQIDKLHTALDQEQHLHATAVTRINELQKQLALPESTSHTKEFSQKQNIFLHSFPQWIRYLAWGSVAVMAAIVSLLSQAQL